jgi:glucose/arabinose dehydrogenase
MRLTSFIRLGFSLCLLAIFIAACRSSQAPTTPEAPLESQITLPAQFEDARVTGVSQPTALAFTPDGTMLITEKTGKLRVFSSSLLSTPALDLSSKVCSDSERGVLGVAVDFEFTLNRYIYLYYTYNKPGTNCATSSSNVAVNRVSRFILGTNNQINPSSEVVLLDNILSYAGNHNAGDVNFGKDGYLYVSIGDGGCDFANNSGCAGDNDAAKDRNTLLGKIIRITHEGEVPPGNPYTGSNTARCNRGSTTNGKTCQEIFVTGLRNPFRFAFDPNSSTTKFHINDVGQNTWEEINVGQVGADYGWNTREGNCANSSTSNCGTVAGSTNPIFAYQHGECNSITGGAFIPNGFWPTEYNDGYLFADYVCGKIFLLKRSGSSYSSSVFASGLGNSSAVHLRFGPDGSRQSLYYTTFAGGGEVRRIRYIGNSNRAPVATFIATPRSGTVPLMINFDASRSSDPDSDALSYEWNFGNGSTGTGKIIQKTYGSAGKFNVTLTVRDSKSATSTKIVTVFPGNSAPVPTITSPSSSARFGVGDTITLQGTATDAQDGTLSGSSLRWSVNIRHNSHTHPYVSTTTGNSLTLTMPAPEDLAATSTSWLEVRLAAVDSQGLSGAIVVKVLPALVNVNFASNPTGRNVTVNGVNVTAPKAIKAWRNYTLRVNAPDQSNYVFQSWSDGGAQAHTVKTPSSDSSYTATFRVQ